MSDLHQRGREIVLDAITTARREATPTSPSLEDIAEDAAERLAEAELSGGRSADEWRLLWLAWKNWADGIVPPALSPSGPDSDYDQRRAIGAKLAIHGLTGLTAP